MRHCAAVSLARPTRGLSNGALLNLWMTCRNQSLQGCSLGACEPCMYSSTVSLSHTFPCSRRKRGPYKNFLLENLPAAVIHDASRDARNGKAAMSGEGYACTSPRPNSESGNTTERTCVLTMELLISTTSVGARRLRLRLCSQTMPKHGPQSKRRFDCLLAPESRTALWRSMLRFAFLS